MLDADASSIPFFGAADAIEFATLHAFYDDE
jgi:hypothetical protein